MGVRLIVEVLDHAPPDLTTAERLLLVVIAENANDTTRQGWPGMDKLSRRTGLSAAGVSKALYRLAGRGLEIRVPLGTDSSGRPVFACKGRQTTYRLPSLRKGQSPDHRPANDAPKPGPSSDHSDGKGRTVVRQRSDGGPAKVGPPSAPSPQEPSRNPQQRGAQIVTDKTEATPDGKAAVLAEIRRRKPDVSDALVGHIYREEGAAILAELQEHAARQRIAEWRNGLATMPACPDGQAGGDQLRPDTGEPQCALCRARHRRAAA